MTTDACWILCCECGTTIQPNSANMCLPCIRKRVDITEGIPKQILVHYCRNCERYLQPPDHWVACTLESRELLAICLKKLKGLNKVKLMDASFLWTEPHSKRLKVKLVIQKEIFSATLLEQAFIIEGIICNQQCKDCMHVMSQNTWQSVVQVRQKVSHKKTLLYMEQIILKHRAHKDATNIKTRHDGLDFYFQHKTHALHLIDFLSSFLPLRQKTSEQLVSADIQNGTAKYKHTFCLELAPICRYDLVCLPPKLVKTLGGGMSPLCVCTRVTNSLHLMDPRTLHSIEVSGMVYWRTPFTSLAAIGDAIPFVVLDVDPVEKSSTSPFVLVDVQIIRQADLGREDTTFYVRTYLGKYLRPGDVVLGYDLTRSNFNNEDYDAFKENGRGITDDIILVKKSFEEYRTKKRAQARKWKLQRLPQQQDDMMEEDDDASIMTVEKIDVEAQKKKKKSGKQVNIKDEIVDMELFMQEIEEDPEIRPNILFYKNNDQDEELITDLAGMMDDLSILPQ